MDKTNSSREKYYESVKKIKSNIRKYKLKLLLESMFPVFSGRSHSIPDVIGPAKLGLDIMLIVGIVCALIEGLVTKTGFITAVLGAISCGSTATLFAIDFDKSEIERIKNEGIAEITEKENDDQKQAKLISEKIKKLEEELIAYKEELLKLSENKPTVSLETKETNFSVESAENNNPIQKIIK